jgi:hypothetical protein
MCTLEFHLFTLYMGVLNFGQTIWDKTPSVIGNILGTHMGTFWGLDGNIWEQGEKI